LRGATPGLGTIRPWGRRRGRIPILMNLSEIRVRLLGRQRDKLRAFASITIDDTLVVRDIKIIDGPRGLFVAMPSRRLQDRCPSCAGRNHLRARYCNDCGTRLEDSRVAADATGRTRLYADVAHPIHQDARDTVAAAIVEAFEAELLRSKEEGYRAVTFDDLDYEAHDAEQGAD
jgi:stage V sporulation protein G